MASRLLANSASAASGLREGAPGPSRLSHHTWRVPLTEEPNNANGGSAPDTASQIAEFLVEAFRFLQLR